MPDKPVICEALRLSRWSYHMRRWLPPALAVPFLAACGDQAPPYTGGSVSKLTITDLKVGTGDGGRAGHGGAGAIHRLAI